VPDLSRVNLSLADEPLNVAINERLERTPTTDLPRYYLGASSLRECLRQTQYAWWCKPLLTARTRSIFARGHYFEKHTRERLIADGYAFAPSEALEFIALGGLFQGHADGIVISAPAMPGAYLATPCVWEHKGLNNKNFRTVARDGLERAFPHYELEDRARLAPGDANQNQAGEQLLQGENEPRRPLRVVHEARGGRPRRGRTWRSASDGAHGLT
jgi:hypothetical protein